MPYTYDSVDVSGFKRPSGRLIRNARRGYYAFVPSRLPARFEKDDEFIELLSRASQKLGELAGLGRALEETLGNITRRLVMPYLQNEAVLSSRIEGTLSTLQEVMENEIGIAPKGEDSRGSMREVTNYIRAQDAGIDMIRHGKQINTALIRRLHQILLRGVRGEEAIPGDLRELQNYISQPGQRIGSATYVPPPPEMVRGLLNSLFSYMETSREPILVRLGMMHYQFEAIHPFLDGNGRIGRLLIILYLMRQKTLDIPLLYMSAYFERNRMEYYSLLLEVSRNSSYLQWMKFFLTGVSMQAESVISKTNRLLEYYDSLSGRIKEECSSAKAHDLFLMLFSNPVMTIPRAADRLGISYPAAKAAIQEMVGIGVLKPLGGKHRAKRFIASSIFDIFRS